MKLFMSSMIALFALVSVVPYAQASSARENPVHERRKAWREKRSEHYKGQRIINSDEKQAELKKKQEAEKEAKADQERLAVLIKEFDKNADGVISAEEMKAAQIAGKDKELQALLEKEKLKKEAAKKAKKTGAKDKVQP
jgi:hypothetical protein